MQVTAHKNLPPYTTFIYPKIRQYLFDEVCEKIIRALEKRNWTIPDIKVEFDDSGTGEEKYRHVCKIKGKDFKLWFCRVQGVLNVNRNDIAAVRQIIIPQKRLHVSKDVSSASYYIYTGDNWEDDRDSFSSDLDLKLKLNYLEYKSSYSSPGLMTSSQNISSASDYDDTEISTSLNINPQHILSKKIFRVFRNWLSVHVLQKIELFEEVTNIEPALELPIPYPKNLGPFYLKIDQKTYERISQGKKDKSQLKPSERYAITGGGTRLVHLFNRNDGSFPKEAYDGYTYGGLSPEFFQKYVYKSLLQVNPRDANHIYVVDYAPSKLYLEQFKEKRLFADEELADEELDESERITARTLIPIYQYKGDYENPGILIGSSKELTFDEVDFFDVKDDEGDNENDNENDDENDDENCCTIS